MSRNELQSLDEALEYLNEGLFGIFKNKNHKSSKDNSALTRYLQQKGMLDTVYIITSDSRKKFVSSVISKCRSIAAKYKFAAYDNKYSIMEYFENFYMATCGYKNPSFNYDNELDDIIFGSYLDRIPKGMTEEDFCRSEEILKWNSDVENAVDDCRKAFSKYGEIDYDGSKDEFYIYLKLNKDTIEMLEKEDDKIMQKKAKSIANEVFKYYEDELVEDATDKYEAKKSDLFVELYDDQCNREFINFCVNIKNCDGWYDFKVNPYMWDAFVKAGKKSSHDGVDYNFND